MRPRLPGGGGGEQAEEELHPPEPEDVGAWFSNPGGLATAGAGPQVGGLFFFFFLCVAWAAQFRCAHLTSGRMEERLSLPAGADVGGSLPSVTLPLSALMKNP